MPETKNTVQTNMYEALAYKPVPHIETLIDWLSPHANLFRTSTKQIINYETYHSRQCFLLLEGTVALFRSRDCFMLNSESAPYVFGLSNQSADANYLHMQTLEESIIASIPLCEANRIIAEHNLWQSLAKVLIYTAGRIYEHCTRIYAPSSYDIIRSQLYELMEESTEIRLSITAANYIQTRTFLSRSSIMKILADLRKGGYITTRRGVLMDIPHRIPLKY